MRSNTKLNLSLTRRLLALGAIAAAVALLHTGCGDSGGTTLTVPPSSTTGVPTTTGATTAGAANGATNSGATTSGLTTAGATNAGATNAGATSGTAGAPQTRSIATTTNSAAPTGFAFESPVTVKAGTVVTWSNQSGAPHSVIWDTPTPSSAPAPGPNIPIFNSGSTSTPWTVPTVTSNTTYGYFCGIHGRGMSGQINVTP